MVSDSHSWTHRKVIGAFAFKYLNVAATQLVKPKVACDVEAMPRGGLPDMRTLSRCKALSFAC